VSGGLKNFVLFKKEKSAYRFFHDNPTLIFFSPVFKIGDGFLHDGFDSASRWSKEYFWDFKTWWFPLFTDMLTISV
jgi:hypothetical protein